MANALRISTSDQASALVGVAKKYNIPVNALLGIYGIETDFGRNVTTSKASAAGPFQFIPSTAKQYGYPYTNTPTLAQFQQQADAWGKYLVANNPSRGKNGWAPAMGGGYTEAQAEATIKNAPPALIHAIAQGAVSGSGSTPGVSGAPSNPGQIVSSVPDAINAFTDRIGAAVAGVAADAKYAAVLVVVLFVAGYLIVKGGTGGGGRERMVPVPA